VKAHLVGYDLNRPGQNYSELISELNNTPGHLHQLDSTWLLATNETTAQVRDRLARHIDTGDELLVVDVTGSDWAASGLPSRAVEWLRKHIS
jgi:hypothetical protein